MSAANHGNGAATARNQIEEKKVKEQAKVEVIPEKPVNKSNNRAVNALRSNLRNLETPVENPIV